MGINMCHSPSAQNKTDTGKKHEYVFESKFQDSKKLKEKGMRKRRHKKQNYWLSHKGKHPFLLFLKYTFLEVIEELYTIYSEKGKKYLSVGFCILLFKVYLIRLQLSQDSEWYQFPQTTVAEAWTQNSNISIKGPAQVSEVPICPLLPAGLRTGSGIHRLPLWLSGKESACQCRRCKRRRFNLWIGKIS